LLTPILILGENMPRRPAVERYPELAECLDKWERTYGAKYPQEEASLPALLGPLLYPGSRLIRWSSVSMYRPEDRPAWEIETATDDDLEDVIAYYMTVLPEGLDRNNGTFQFHYASWWFESSPQLSADGRRTWVTIKGVRRTFRIHFHTEEDRSDSSTLRTDWHDAAAMPDAWPEAKDCHLRRVQQHQKPMLEELRTIFSDVAYPNAQLAWGRFDYRNWRNDAETDYFAFRTRDSIDTVFEHFARYMPTPREGTSRWFTDKRADGFERVVFVFPLMEKWDKLDGVVIQYSYKYGEADPTLAQQEGGAENLKQP
jgi:hypothetical protein